MQGCGVLIMGIRSRAYGEMAVNLANSLKAYCPDVPLCGISDGSIESVPEFKKAFDSIVSVPRGSNPFELKTKLNEFSPFEKTLYIDADSIFISDPSELFASLEGVKFACMEYRRHDKDSITGPIWATCEEIFDHYGLGQTLYPEYNSSVIFWEKSIQNDGYFKSVNYIYSEIPSCKLIQDVGGFFPDEIAFGVASASLYHYSEIEKWQPAYLQWDTKVTPESTIMANYCLLTRSGAREDQYIDRIYNSAAAKAAKKLSTAFYKFNVKNKVHGTRN